MSVNSLSLDVSAGCSSLDPRQTLAQSKSPTLLCGWGLERVARLRLLHGLLFLTLTERGFHLAADAGEQVFRPLGIRSIRLEFKVLI